MRNQRRFLFLAALMAAISLWAALVAAQNLATVSRTNSRHPRENHAEELRICVSRAYANGPVQLGVTPVQQPLSSGEFMRRYENTASCGRVGRNEALQVAVASGLVEGGSSSGMGAPFGTTALSAPPQLGSPPPIPTPQPNGQVATAQQVVNAEATGHRVVIVEVAADTGPPVVAAPRPVGERPAHCTTCGHSDAGADAADASHG